MSKTKTPFFGLDAHGSVGGSITAQGLPKVTLVRTKPLPTYRYTLPQAYQRWLYEDYAYLWRQQSAATQSQYRSAGVRFHLTGFQYWMKDMLTRLPDIAAWWKYDINTLPTTPDSSRNSNTGTVIGASPDTGIIDQCFSFDGLNDRIDAPTTTSLDTLTGRTLIVFYKPPPFTGSLRFIEHHSFLGGGMGDQIYLSNNANTFNLDVRNNAGWILSLVTPFTPDSWNCTGYTWDGTNVLRYHQGLPYDIPRALVLDSHWTATDFQIAHRALANWGLTLIDNVILFNRALDGTEMLRWSLRRYPP